MRKEVHINHLNDADMDTLIVTAADKAHNARSIATDLQNQGDSLWDRFNGKREDIIWYYESVYAVLHHRKVTSTLLTPLRNAIDVMSGSPTVWVILTIHSRYVEVLLAPTRRPQILPW